MQEACHVITMCYCVVGKVEEMSEQLSAVRQELLTHKLITAEEIISYKQQVKALQKVFIHVITCTCELSHNSSSLEFD